MLAVVIARVDELTHVSRPNTRTAWRRGLKATAPTFKPLRGRGASRVDQLHSTKPARSAGLGDGCRGVQAAARDRDKPHHDPYTPRTLSCT
jgi:hypothetical protein